MSTPQALDIHVLVVDDDARLLDILRKHLDRLGYQVTAAAGAAEALALIDDSFRPDVVLADVKMPGMDGRTLMQEAHRRDPSIRFILMTAFGEISEAVDAMRQGAYWYVAKPFKVDDVAVILTRAAGEVTLGRRIARLEERLRTEYGPNRYLGRSPLAEQVRRDLERAASLPTAVLLLGRTGSGKELAARILHAASRAVEGPFVPVNCSAIPESLFESELFGHRRGAFTGAVSDARGLVEEATGGTLFLDEVGDLPPAQQPKLLRLLEEKEIRRVGDRNPIKVDVRVVAATNQPLEALVREGRFRQDLYYRLSPLVIRLPDLAERLEDIPPIAESLLMECARAAGLRAKGFTAAALDKLRGYDWPGNVRELRNAIEQALFRTKGPVIDADDLPGWVGGRARDSEGPYRDAAEAGRLPTLDEIERQHVERVLVSTAWNRSRAAQTLGIDRRTLFARIQKYGLTEPSRPRSESPGTK